MTVSMTNFRQAFNNHWLPHVLIGNERCETAHSSVIHGKALQYVQFES